MSQSHHSPGNTNICYNVVSLSYVGSYSNNQTQVYIVDSLKCLRTTFLQTWDKRGSTKTHKYIENSKQDERMCIGAYTQIVIRYSLLKYKIILQCWPELGGGHYNAPIMPV
jgi:hypothetical protein